MGEVTEGRPGRSYLTEALELLPNLTRLLFRLMRDPRVPVRSRALVMFALAYLVSPVELIPDRVPVVGRIDDLLVTVLALHHLLAGAGEELVREHWDGSSDVLEIIRGLLEWGAGTVPWPLRRAAARYVGTA